MTCPSTSSRSTGRSSPTCSRTRATRRSCAPRSTSPTRSSSASWPRASRTRPPSKRYARWAASGCRATTSPSPCRPTHWCAGIARSASPRRRPSAGTPTPALEREVRCCRAPGALPALGTHVRVPGRVLERVADHAPRLGARHPRRAHGPAERRPGRRLDRDLPARLGGGALRSGQREERRRA